MESSGTAIASSRKTAYSLESAHPGQEYAMSRNSSAIFADIDAFDPDKFVAHLTQDAVFRFGNADPVVGRAAVREAVAGFFSTIDGLTHHVLDSWDVGDTTIVRIDVEYRARTASPSRCPTPTSSP